MSGKMSGEAISEQAEKGRTEEIIKGMNDQEEKRRGKQEKKNQELDPVLAIEALLFSTGKAMSIEEISLFTGLTKQKTRNALKKLKKKYEDQESALKIYDDNNTWRMMVKDQYIPLVRKIIANTELSRATMETLAVIAYKYPKINQSEVIHIRGTTAYDHIRELLELGFITRQKEGRSYAIRLTEKFFEYFDIEGEKDIKEVFKEAEAEMPKEKQKILSELTKEGIEIVDEENPKEKENKGTGQEQEDADKNKVIKELEEEGVSIVDLPEEENNDKRAEDEENNGEGLNNNYDDYDNNGSYDSDDSSETPLSEELAEKVEVNKEEEEDFLKKIDEQIEAISKKNDELEDDELFKKPDYLLNKDSNDNSGNDSTGGSGGDSDESQDNQKNNEQ